MPFAGEIYEGPARVGFWNITESEAVLRAGITLSPASMSLVNGSGSEKRRRELLAVRSLMHRMGISDSDLYYDGDKPLLHSERYISISHSGTMACVALSADEPVGIDIQEIKPRLSAVMKWLLRAKKTEREEDLGLIRSGLLWTAKEAMYKLGGGKDAYMRDLEVVLPEGEPGLEGHLTGYQEAAEGRKDYRIAYRVMDGYIFAVAWMKTNG